MVLIVSLSGWGRYETNYNAESKLCWPQSDGRPVPLTPQKDASGKRKRPASEGGEGAVHNYSEDAWCPKCHYRPCRAAGTVPPDLRQISAGAREAQAAAAAAAPAAPNRKYKENEDELYAGEPPRYRRHLGCIL